MGQIEELHKLLELAKEVITPEELKNLFLDKVEKESSAWHTAAYMGHIEVLHKLWDWAIIH